MRDYSHIVGKITSAPWAIEENALKMILEIMDAHMSGKISQDEIRVRLADADRRGTRDHASRVQNIGVLGITGPIFPKANLMTELSGGTTVAQLRQDFRSMMADDAIDAILLDVDSPGGFSEGIMEMADEIFAARDQKPIYSIANANANSAAYWLASQASEMYATPSGQVGSVGTYMVHTDKTDAQEKMGVKRTVIKAGRFKAMLDEPLTAENRGVLQSFVDEVNDGFIAGVARARGTEVDDVRSNYGEGMVVTPKRALEAGMIDGIGTIEQVLAHIGGSLQTNTPVGSRSAGVLVTKATSASNSYDADKEHSEPGTGTGGEPTPRTPPEEGDPAIEGGWRRDPPPPAYETEESAVNRTWLEEQATALGIEFNTEMSDEDLASAVSARVSEVVVPLNEATQEAQNQIDFREAYPEQARQLEELTRETVQNRATAFADSYRTFGDDSHRGFAPVVRDLIADAHLKIATRQFSHDDLKTLLDAASKKEAVVPLGEGGSSRASETQVVAAGVDARKQFHELVKAAMTEDGLTRKAAIKHVSEQNPELALAYKNS